MKIRYTCCSHWNADNIFNLILREDLQEDSPEWEDAYDAMQSDEPDYKRRTTGSPRLSTLL